MPCWPAERVCALDLSRESKHISRACDFCRLAGGCSRLQALSHQLFYTRKPAGLLLGMPSLPLILQLHSWLLPLGHVAKTRCWALTLVSCTSRPWAFLHFLGPPGFCLSSTQEQCPLCLLLSIYDSQPFSFASGENGGFPPASRGSPWGSACPGVVDGLRPLH